MRSAVDERSLQRSLKPRLIEEWYIRERSSLHFLSNARLPDSTSPSFVV